MDGSNSVDVSNTCHSVADKSFSLENFTLLALYRKNFSQSTLRENGAWCYFAVFHFYHPVCQGHAGWPVGDQDHGALIQKILAFFDEIFLPLWVEHRGCLVQNQDGRVRQQRSG